MCYTCYVQFKSFIRYSNDFFIMPCEIILSLLLSDKSISFIKCGRPKKKQLPERCTSRDIVKVEWFI